MTASDVLALTPVALSAGENAVASSCARSKGMLKKNDNGLTPRRYALPLIDHMIARSVPVSFLSVTSQPWSRVKNPVITIPCPY